MSPSDIAARVAGLVGSERFSDDHGTAKVYVERAAWVEAHQTLRSEMPYFSWLSAIDWTTDVAVGDPPEAEDVDVRYEILSCLGNLESGESVVLSTDLAKEDATIDSLADTFGGANWHEREAAEMFGIEFTGHPNLTKIYLPDGFEGHPLRKSFGLASRDVKPWPGTVDVEAMPGSDDGGPSTDNPEAAE
jgi:NADH:ubiquinone oxidoreductase subunit C